jgi:hypothetical protein
VTAPTEQPPRKLRKVDLTERSTLQGLTTGIVKLRLDEDLLPCVVFGGECVARIGLSSHPGPLARGETFGGG